MKKYRHRQCIRVSWDRDIVDGNLIRVPRVYILNPFKKENKAKWRQLGYEDWQEYQDSKWNQEQYNKRYSLVPGRHDEN